MNRLKSLISIAILAAASMPALAAEAVLDGISLRPLAADAPVDLAARHKGQVLLVVNTASKCGFTSQYEGLEALQQRNAARGFAVLGFPSNDFKGQEPGSEAEIQEFCTLTYGVKFPMYEKVHVIGPDTTPLYRRLEQATGTAPGWNFHKYLVSRDGRVVGNWSSRVKPDDPAIVAAIERELKAAAPR